jgi:hypothetical protein
MYGVNIRFWTTLAIPDLFCVSFVPPLVRWSPAKSAQLRKPHDVSSTHSYYSRQMPNASLFTVPDLFCVDPGPTRYPDRLQKVLISANITAGVDPESALACLVPAFLLKVQAKDVGTGATGATG